MIRSSVGRGVLITGCSSGIGLATALAFYHRGYTVWAGVRRAESQRRLAALGRERLGGGEGVNARWRPTRLDVADPEQVAQVAEAIRRSGVPLVALVNNAGYGQFGALEDLTEEGFRRQWEVNVAGAWRTTRACLPLLRKAGAGSTVVNVSSILGRLAMPFGGAYSASKFALEALSDALRVEVAPWDIRVVVVEPGPIATRFSDNSRLVFEVATGSGSSLYEGMYKKYLRRFEGPSRRWGELPAVAVARVIVDAVQSRRPRTRYLVTLPAVLAAWARWAAPDRWVDWILRRFLNNQ